MNRFTTHAAATLLGLATLIPIHAVAAIIPAPDENGNSPQVNTAYATEVAFEDEIKVGHASHGQKADSLNALAFSGTSVTPGLAGSVKLNVGDGMLADISTVPLPAAAWLFASAFLGLCWLGRRAGMRGVGMLPR